MSANHRSNDAQGLRLSRRAYSSCGAFASEKLLPISTITRSWRFSIFRLKQDNIVQCLQGRDGVLGPGAPLCAFFAAVVAWVGGSPFHSDRLSARRRIQAHTESEFQHVPSAEAVAYKMV